MVVNFSLILIIVLTYWFSAIKFKLLTHLGAATAIIGGALIYIAFNWKGLIIIGLFFLSSSFWSRFTGHTKVIKDKDVRNSFQVLANGGGAFTAALGYYISQDTAWTAFFLASLAAANADTWASEIGVLSKGNPFHIKKLKRVQPGMSGAVTFIGTFAALCGALLISILGVILFQTEFQNELLAIILFTSIGFIGCLLDTIIGAFFEATYKCKTCGQIVEQKNHCGRETIQNSGIHMVGNNQVNFITTFLAGCVGGLFYWF